MWMDAFGRGRCWRPLLNSWRFNRARWSPGPGIPSPDIGLLLSNAVPELIADDAQRGNITVEFSIGILPHADIEGVIEDTDSDAVRGLVARAANRHLGKSDREAAGVLSAAQRHTHFLDSPRMTAVLSRSDFRFADLKRNNVTVFLVLPPDRLSTYSRWLRLLVSQSLIEMARDPTRPAAPVLYLLDEFASLGHLAPVERAMGLMAGYGVQLWPILQDIHQLRATYGHRAGTFLSNAGVLQVFGVNDHDSARLISDLLGQETVVFQTMARALDSDKTGISYDQTVLDAAWSDPVAQMLRGVLRRQLPKMALRDADRQVLEELLKEENADGNG
ncbi:hypothetical protein At1D1460_28120 [Agrobacterium tumefaciens]|nr:hypothetical protein At1D1460_28120 [Agrobacterium tumefaciens]